MSIRASLKHPNPTSATMVAVISETGVWTIIIPMKPLADGKTRLRGARGSEVTPNASQLAQAFLRDVIEAAQGAAKTSRVVVTSADPAIARVTREGRAQFLPEPANPRTSGPGKPGLNEAITAALASVTQAYGAHPVAVVTGDLATLRSSSLDLILEAVETLGRSGFVADVAGSGTTILALLPSPVPTPRFGPNSAQAHRAEGVCEVSHAAGDDARLDIDTPDDLRAAIRLGVGLHTRDALAQWAQAEGASYSIE